MQEPLITPSMRDEIIPIKIRDDLTIYIYGIPYDITEREAQKIANIITALVSSTHP